MMSCRDNSPVQVVVDQYKTGEISEDSILHYLSDSINLGLVIEWADKHKSNDDFAKYVLGRAYKFGLGVERNPQKSKAYYISSALDGNTNAMQGLAHLYAGYPEYEDLDSAVFWYSKAAEQGIGSSYFYLSQLEVQRKGKKNMPVDTLTILGYWKRGMELNDPLCLSALAYAYYYGQGVNQDKAKAFNMLNLADYARLDHSGLFLLGLMCELGETAQQNFNEALKYYQAATNKGNTDAICKLGNFYQFGQGVEKNDSLAFLEYQKAANAGNTWGMRCVGSCYHNGIGVNKNVSNAWHWYKIAAKNGDIEAQRYCQKNNVDYLDY